jgi:hypothetical protein
MLRRLALAAAALALIVAPAALADGDPASDVLPSQDAFYPYSPQASRPLVQALNGLLAQVRRSGYPMKVAMIASQADLGSYPTMFNQPQRYADLLASELPVNPHGSVRDALHLLVVMPGGFGGTGLGDRVDEALAPVGIDVKAGTDGLVRAALESVARIATVNGHRTAVPDEASGGGGGGGNTGLLIAVGALVVLLAGALVVVRRRAAASDARPVQPPEAQARGEDART